MKHQTSFRMFCFDLLGFFPENDDDNFVVFFMISFIVFASRFPKNLPKFASSISLWHSQQRVIIFFRTRTIVFSGYKELRAARIPPPRPVPHMSHIASLVVNCINISRICNSSFYRNNFVGDNSPGASFRKADGASAMLAMSPDLPLYSMPPNVLSPIFS